MAKPKAAAPARFEGFADREARFFRALAKQQSREWFAEHRDEYRVGWLEPMALLAKLRRQGFGEDAYEQLQRVPRGLDPEHPRADLLRRKGLVAVFPAPARALLVSRKLVDALVRHAKQTVPLVEWLAAVSV